MEYWKELDQQKAGIRILNEKIFKKVSLNSIKRVESLINYDPHDPYFCH